MINGVIINVLKIFYSIILLDFGINTKKYIDTKKLLNSIVIFLQKSYSK